jgi:hypothetical protein
MIERVLSKLTVQSRLLGEPLTIHRAGPLDITALNAEVYSTLLR